MVSKRVCDILVKAAVTKLRTAGARSSPEGEDGIEIKVG